MIEKEKKVLKLEWIHNGMYMTCEVGDRLPEYYETKDELVLSITEKETCFVIRTKSRGGESGPPVMAGMSDKKKVVYA